MKTSFLRSGVFLSVITLLLAACSSSQAGDMIVSMLATDSAGTVKTVEALQIQVHDLSTQVAGQKNESTPTQIQSPTIPPLTTQASQTSNLTPTSTKLVDTGDHADYVSDMIPDGTRFGPGTQFTQKWTLVNKGETTWTTDYAAVFVAGDPLGYTTRVPVPRSISPNMTVDITLQMTAPATYGKYRSEWLMENDKGQKFGLGEEQIVFWVDIEVADVPTTTEIPGYIQSANITHVVVTDENCSNYTFEMSGHIMAFSDYGFYDKNITYRWRIEGPGGNKELNLSGQLVKDNNLYIGPDEIKYPATEGQEILIWLDVLRPSEKYAGPWTHKVICNY